MGYGAHSSLQTTAGFSESVRDIDEQRNLIIPRKRMPDSNPPFYQETQDDIVSEYRSLSRHLAHIYHELAENRMLIQQLKQAESREASDKRLIAARYTNTHTPRDYLELRLENDSTEDLDSSASDIFFDCMSRVSMEDFFDVDMSHTTFSTSPHGYFEKSSSFYPEQYTVDGLFSHQIFVVSIKPSKNDYRTQMYFLLYAETPRKWRRIVVSAIFGEVHKRLAFLRDYAPENFEVEYKMLPKILETELNVLLPRLELFKSVTSLTLTFTQNESGQMIRSSPTKVREDLLEAQVSREDEILNNIEDLGCAQFLETEIIVQSRMSSSCFMVRVENRTCIERKAPFVRSGIDNENGFHNFFNDLKLLKSMRGCTGVAEFIGVVLDDTRSHLRSYLYEYPAHNILTVLVCAESKPEIVPWRIRETWARQIIKAVSEVHSNGYPVGGLLWLNDIGIRSNGTVLLTCLRTSQRYFQQGKGRVAPELFTASYTNTTTFMKRVTFRTEVFQLGLILWMLVEHKNNTAGLFCSKFGCTCYPRYRCTADHANPIELPPCSSGIPSYFNDIINQCRLRDPKMRPTACKLAESLPLRENDQPAGVEDILKRYARTQTFCLYCDECGTRQMSVHYSCRFCCQGDFDLCQTCFAQGVHCYNPSHLPVKRIIKADGTKVEAPD